MKTLVCASCSSLGNKCLGVELLIEDTERFPLHMLAGRSK